MALPILTITKDQLDKNNVYVGASLGGMPISQPDRDPGPPLPKLNRFGKLAGPRPQVSKPLSNEYRLTVRAQRGFTTRRLEQLRADWRKHCDTARRERSEPTAWWKWLEDHRNANHPVEGSFDIMNAA